ncbi:hypothetical protein PRZ48_002144 [Zasmidium cellare]|uniref:N-acetyltransferase domain-containing protein n=1 Tax=Zasmidium cellare TaxID=395010 RepID=A0ABR0F509_ZASCE|nr:hypothetical protein PRZ48_002144 [Zasmidium cellare]
MSPLIIEQYTPEGSPRSKARSASFGIAKAQYEDIRRLVDIEFLAFEQEKTNHILSYRDYDQPAHFERAVKAYEASMAKAESTLRRLKTQRSWRPRVDLTRFRKVVDADSGEVVSWAKTELKTYSYEELASPADIGHEEDPQMNRDWFALNEQLRRDYMGTKQHMYISMVATEPRYQHHGAGTMLLEDILAEADTAGLECYLEATDTAKPLYERHGFVTVNELRFDPAVYGVEGFKRERQTIMVRGAVDARGQRKVRCWEEAVPGKQAQL